MANLWVLMRRPLVDSIFQPLELELAPVLEYLSGRVLNAGCGGRDLTSFLLAHGATAVDNCDLDSPIPNTIQCDLARIPMPDSSYDAIICNAVLEHVGPADEIVRELHRLLRPGGHLVLTIPFLQPYHPCPGDFRRFACDGMVQLAGQHLFEVVNLLPVHSMAQTITWILWECLEEKRMRTTQLLLKLPLLLWCRLSQRTDFGLRRNANAFQAVLRKPITRS